MNDELHNKSLKIPELLQSNEQLGKHFIAQQAIQPVFTK